MGRSRLRALAAWALLAAATLLPAADASSRDLIVGGGPANASGWSFVVVLQQKRRSFCGGAVVAPTKIVTAAHCAKRVKLKTLSALTGSPWISGRRRGERIGIASVAIEPRYNGKKDARDLAVLTLERPTAAPPVALPTRPEGKAATRPGEVLRSAGWGTRSAWGFRAASRLKAAMERVYGARRCQRAFSKNGFQGASMICTLGKRIRRFHGRLGFRTSSCFGDSGGPLVADTPAGPRLVGVVSVGSFPCGLYAPSIYARVSEGLRFIRGALASS